ncbi:unnamed protein product [Anisakis simplex]|nr:unnamed protein product [Anisakis simplex]
MKPDGTTDIECDEDTFSVRTPVRRGSPKPPVGQQHFTWAPRRPCHSAALDTLRRERLLANVRRKLVFDDL